MSSDGATIIGKQLSIEGVDSVHGGMTITQAREAVGMSLEELSAKLKVSVRKLELVERGEFDKVAGGQAHVRGLVRAMCKQVGVEPESILALLPSADHRSGLDQMDTQFRAPFAASGRMGKLGANTLPRAMARPKVAGQAAISNGWIVGAMLAAVAALALYAWPAIQPAAERAYASIASMASLTMSTQTSTADKAKADAQNKKAIAVEKTNEAKAAPTDMPPGISTNVTIAPAETQSVAPLQTASGAAASDIAGIVVAANTNASASQSGVLMSPISPMAAMNDEKSSDKLVIQATSPSWIEIRSASGNLLVSRSLNPGERLEQGLERRRYVVIGNAASTQVWVRGKVFDVLAQASGNNVARFDIE
jgi:cytoskeleton protein RodZ